MQDNINYYSVIYKEMNLTYYPFLIKLSTIFNIPIKDMNFSRVYSLYDTLTVDRYLNRNIP